MKISKYWKPSEEADSIISEIPKETNSFWKATIKVDTLSKFS